MYRLRFRLWARKAYFFFKSFWKEFLTGGVTLAANYVASLYAKDPSRQLFLSSVIILTGIVLVMIFLTREKSFYYRSFTSRNDIDDWLGTGVFAFDRANYCYTITESNQGNIFSPTLSWSDYQLSFDFKINNQCLGVVVRAVNLANYCMLQIRQHGIRPHVKINGIWIPNEAEDVGLSFGKGGLALDAWHSCNIACVGQNLDITISQGKTTILSRRWILPAGKIEAVIKVEGYLAAPAVPGDKNAAAYEANLEYGTVGFRNSRAESAFVRNLLIKKI
jgi:hypothetical protein